MLRALTMSCISNSTWALSAIFGGPLAPFFSRRASWLCAGLFCESLFGVGLLQAGAIACSVLR